ncbi:MAG: hypothetical protein IKQ76_01255 [Bacteroidales bacterium]|nr:hypothetical protein [Bacteroidales bacterium]
MTTTLLKHSAPQIHRDMPYKECYTEREAVGKSLTSIINSLELGGTIALTGEWGSGKTTFLNMWRQDLINQGFPTVSLNAWETEWADDPLIAVIACIYSACNEDSLSEKQKINNKLKRLLKKPLPILGAIATSMAEAALSVDVKSVIEKCKEISSQAFDDEVDSFTERASAMQELKKTLESLAWKVNQGKADKPLVFIIDELDRCKPDYSVRTLEVLKHIFEVKNIVFVCAIDKKHLEDSIRGFYGSERINSAEYLRRFFDLEVELPVPNYQMYCDHLYKYYKLDEFFDTPERIDSVVLSKDGSIYRTFLASLANRRHMSLRQIERICAFTKLTLLGKNNRIYFWPGINMLITYLRFFENSLYQDIRSRRLTIQELLDRLILVFGDMIDKKPEKSRYDNNNRRFMLFAIGEVLVSYNCSIPVGETIIINGDSKTTPLKCSIFNQEELLESLDYATRKTFEYDLSWVLSILDILKIDESIS